MSGKGAVDDAYAEDLEALFGAWLGRCEADRALARASAGLMATVRLAAGAFERGLSLRDGAIVAAPAKGGGADVTIAAAPAAWLRLLTRKAVAPGWQSFGAIIRLNSAFEVTGSALVVAQALAALERMFQLASPCDPLPAQEVARDPAIAVGRTTRLRVGTDGAEELIYWEQSGTGTPLLMLHTAGADSRQYRHQLWDVELAKEFRMYAFDMPGHGRSGMPRGWLQGEVYTLTLEDYLATCVAFLEKVVEAPSIVVGCSMGAAMSLVLAARRPDLVLGVLALEAPWRAPGRKSPYLAHAQVNAGMHNSAYVTALLSPLSPRERREEAGWIYSQAGPGIYAGDLEFYSNEFDGEVVGQALSDTEVPIHLLTGDFDYSASPENTEKVARLIKGSVFKTMTGLGHFPMIEHPDHFRTMLLPELRSLCARARAISPERTP